MSEQLPINFDVPDISRRKHRGNAESRAAVRRVHPHKSETYRGILNFLRATPGTASEYADYAYTKLHKISGRFSELRAGGLIEPSGDRREGGAVMQHTRDGEKAWLAVQQGLGRIVHENNQAVLVSIVLK